MTLGDFGSEAIMAITIERNTAPEREPQRYQGMVGFQAESLSEAFEQYFEQSEQLPTRIVLFADGKQAVGLLIQQLPESHGDPDDWLRAQTLFETVSAEELFTLEPEQMLFRLFHEESCRVLDRMALSFACSCTPRTGRERIGFIGRRGDDRIPAGKRRHHRALRFLRSGLSVQPSRGPVPVLAQKHGARQPQSALTARFSFSAEPFAESAVKALR